MFGRVKGGSGKRECGYIFGHHALTVLIVGDFPGAEWEKAKRPGLRAIEGE